MNYLKKALFPFVVLLFVAGCTEEDDYKKFIKDGEIYYPGKIENVEVYSGKNRVELFGVFVSDPKVTQCLVYWNIRKDSIIFPVSRTGLTDTLQEVIEIEEGIHNFEFITMDDEGNRSVTVNATGQSYGDNFETQLYNRPVINTSYVEESDSLTIIWAGIDLSTGAYETEVQYNLETNVKSVRTPIDAEQTMISDYDGTGFKYRTFFRPDSTCIDVFWTDFEQWEEN